MPKLPKLHRYSDQTAFDRLFVAIATLARYPGVGCPTGETELGQHHALVDVRIAMQSVARALNLDWEDNYPATATIRKDLELLKDYGILDRRMYRWGYYLGKGALDLAELACALDALNSQAKYQGDPFVRQIAARLAKRFKGLNSLDEGRLFYPVRQQIDSSIVYTDPIEMMEHGKYRHTLFGRLEQLEAAILGGKTIELDRLSNPYLPVHVGLCQMIPLQLIYSDIAWYLIGEHPTNGHLSVNRLDRYSDYYREIDSSRRDLSVQLQRLDLAHWLLTNGWGLNLGSIDEQQAELAKTLELTKIVVRFWSPVLVFIQEGERRHHTQQIKAGKKDELGRVSYLDYEVTLPTRSVNEFMLWVNRFMDAAQIISPPALIDRHLAQAQGIIAKYQHTSSD